MGSDDHQEGTHERAHLDSSTQDLAAESVDRNKETTPEPPSPTDVFDWNEPSPEASIDPTEELSNSSSG